MRLLLLALLLCLLLPASALSQAPEPPPPGPPPPPPPPSAGTLDLRLSGIFHAGSRRIAFIGGEIGVRGVVDPVVAGEQVEVTIRRGRKIVRDKTVTVQPDGFHLTYRSHKRGTLTISARHVASPNQAEMTAKELEVSLVKPSVHRGGRGIVVRFMQQRLASLHYLVPESGRYDGATGRAVLAYRKVNRRRRTISADRAMLLRLAAGSGAFHPRYPDAGKHVEADLGRQVLALINPGGKVYKTLHMSSGKP